MDADGPCRWPNLGQKDTALPPAVHTANTVSMYSHPQFRPKGAYQLKLLGEPRKGCSLRCLGSNCTPSGLVGGWYGETRCSVEPDESVEAARRNCDIDSVRRACNHRG